MNIQEAFMKRREEQDRRYNRDTFEEGDPVVIQDPKTRTWTRKGKVVAKRIAADSTSHSYLVKYEYGNTFLRNGCYLHHEKC